MRVLETRRAHMDMRPRARAMMMSSRDVASMATTGIAIGARCARACVDAREAREMPRARWHIVADVFVSFARAPCGREVSRLVVVVRSARLMRDPRLAGRSLARAW